MSRGSPSLGVPRDEPVPVEGALDRHEHARPVWHEQGEDLGQDVLHLTVEQDLAVLVDDADLRDLRVQIDAALHFHR